MVKSFLEYINRKLCAVYEYRSVYMTNGPFSALPFDPFVTSVMRVIPACPAKTIGANERRLKVDSEPEGTT